MTIPNNANQYLPGVIQIPSALEITAVTQSFPMQVTTIENDSQSNTYRDKQLVRFFIPRSYGMWQLNGLTGQILAVNGTILIVDIDSTNFDAFTTPATFQPQPASLAPSGSRNLLYDNNSAQVPFQSLNNRGN